MSMFTAAILSLLLTSCAAVSEKSVVIEPRRQLVRLTVYSNTADKWTAQGKSSTGKKLISYKTAAADPRDFPYGSQIKIVGMNIVATINDTGGALKRRTAARKMGKNVPVIDLYIASNREKNAFLKRAPHFVWVEY